MNDRDILWDGVSLRYIRNYLGILDHHLLNKRENPISNGILLLKKNMYKEDNDFSLYKIDGRAVFHMYLLKGWHGYKTKTLLEVIQCFLRESRHVK